MPPKVAAVTMAYNEDVLLPIWARHYARQVGADYCYVVDHGSTQATELPPGVNRLRLPRSPHDEPRRAAFMAELVTSLLRYYDWVIHTDVDELVLADPAGATDLTAFCATLADATVTAIGLDMQHVPALEPGLDPHRPVGAQRQWVRFTSAMCKPVLTRQPVRWAPGFHCCDQPIAFAPLYLFHLRWADRTIGRERLARTRAMAWAGTDYAAHQRIAQDEWDAMFDGMAALPRVEPVTFDPAASPMRDWLQRLLASGVGREGEAYRFDLHVNAPELWAVPDRFRAAL